MHAFGFAVALAVTPATASGADVIALEFSDADALLPPRFEITAMWCRRARRRLLEARSLAPRLIRDIEQLAPLRSAGAPDPDERD